MTDTGASFNASPGKICLKILKTWQIGYGRHYCQHCCQSHQDLSDNLADRDRRWKTLLPALLPVPSKICLKNQGRWKIEDIVVSTVASLGKICLKILQTGDKRWEFRVRYF